MSMNGVDYSKQLAETQADFREKLDRADKAQKREIANMQETHEAVQKNQRKNFDSAKAKIEESVQDRVETMNKNVQSAIASKSEQYQEALEKERETFSETRKQMSNEFRERMQSLKDGFRGAEASKDALHSERQAYARDSHAVGLARAEKNYQESIKKNKDTTEGYMKKTTEAFNRELKDTKADNALKIADMRRVNSGQQRNMKDGFRNAIESQSRSFQSKIDGLTEQNRDTKNSQLSAFMQHQAKQKESYERMLDATKDQAKTDLIQERQILNEKVKKLAEENNLSREAAVNKNNQKLAEVRKEFDRALASEQNLNAKKQDMAAENYEKRLGVINDSYNENVARIGDRSSGRGSKLAKQFQESKERLVHDHAKERSELLHAGTKRENMLKDKINKDIANLRKTSEYELNLTRENNQKNFALLKKNKENEIQKTFNHFAEINNDLVQRSAATNIKLNREMADKISDLNASHTKDMRDQRISMGRSNGGDAFRAIREEQEQSTEQKHYERKIEHYKNNTDNVERNFKEQNKHITNRFEKDLTNKRVRYTNELEEVKNEHQLARLNDRVEAKKEISQLENDYNEKSRIDEENYTRQMTAQQRGEKEKMTKLKENFNKTFKDINQRNAFNIQSMKEDFSKDKKAFMDELITRTENDKFRLRKDFDKKMNSIMTTYEREIDKLRNENVLIKQQMVDEINLAREKNMRMIKSEKELLERRNNQNNKIAEATFKKREKELIDQIDATHDQYRKRLNEQNYKQNLKLEMVTRDYEFKIDNIRKTYEQQIALNSNQSNQEIANLKEALDNSRKTLISQYESQMADMRKSHQEQLERFASYKREEARSAKA